MGYQDPNDWQDQLQASLRRAQEAIARGTTQQEQMVREWTDNLRTAYPDWGRERWQRRLERKLRRRAAIFRSRVPISTSPENDDGLGIRGSIQIESRIALRQSP